MGARVVVDLDGERGGIDAVGAQGAVAEHVEHRDLERLAVAGDGDGVAVADGAALALDKHGSDLARGKRGAGVKLAAGDDVELALDRAAGGDADAKELLAAVVAGRDSPVVAPAVGDGDAVAVVEALLATVEILDPEPDGDDGAGVGQVLS